MFVGDGAVKDLDRTDDPVLMVAQGAGLDLDRNAMALLVLQVGVALDGNSGVQGALERAAVRAQHATACVDVAQPVAAAVLAYDLSAQEPRDGFGAAIPKADALLAVYEVHTITNLVENAVVQGRVEGEAQPRLNEG